MKIKSIKPLATVIGASLLASTLSSAASAQTNPFTLNELQAGYQVAESHGGDGAEGKCGEGKCGEKKPEGKCGEGKCGEKKPEGKCGEGKCGEKKPEGTQG